MFTATDVLKPEFIEQPLDTLWSLISPLYMVDETQWLQQLIPLATPTEAEKRTTKQKTTALIEAIRADKTSIQMIDALLLEYSLDTQEGILLMCLASILHSSLNLLIIVGQQISQIVEQRSVIGLQFKYLSKQINGSAQIVLIHCLGISHNQKVDLL